MLSRGPSSKELTTSAIKLATTSLQEVEKWLYNYRTQLEECQREITHLEDVESKMRCIFEETKRQLMELGENFSYEDKMSKVQRKLTDRKSRYDSLLSCFKEYEKRVENLNQILAICRRNVNNDAEIPRTRYDIDGARQGYCGALIEYPQDVAARVGQYLEVYRIYPRSIRSVTKNEDGSGQVAIIRTLSEKEMNFHLTNLMTLYGVALHGPSRPAAASSWFMNGWLFCSFSTFQFQ